MGDLIPALEKLATQFGGAGFRAFIDPGALSSIAPMLCAGLLAAGFLIVRRKGRKVRLKVLLRALFPRRWLFGPSARTDIAFAVFNVFMVGALVSWAVFSGRAISGWAGDLIGPGPYVAAPPMLAAAIATLGLYLAYEFGYWVDHYLSHKVPFLWAFHKVHHSAETLSPLTNFRIHPVNGVIFANIIAVSTGLTGAALGWLFGKAADPFSLWGANILMLVFIYTVVHLQHSHIWIAWRGWPGRIFLSPAHHQVHHSDNPRHFDRNFGGTLCLFDWLFGTLHIPALKRERFGFGVDDACDPHTVTGALITPFFEAARTLAPKPKRAPSLTA